jgi:hypothetical protein
MKKIKLFSTVILDDGREGDVVDIYTKPALGYGIDFTRAGQAIPDPMYDIVKPEKIREVIFEPRF